MEEIIKKYLQIKEPPVNGNKNREYNSKLSLYKNKIIKMNNKVSKVVIEYAKANKFGVIVIVNLKDIKQWMNYNKNFVQILLHKLVKKQVRNIHQG